MDNMYFKYSALGHWKKNYDNSFTRLVLSLGEYKMMRATPMRPHFQTLMSFRQSDCRHSLVRFSCLEQVQDFGEAKDNVRVEGSCINGDMRPSSFLPKSLW